MADNVVSFKSEQLPQYLASLGLNPYQITAVVYGIFREVKLLGTLTPGNDNSLHLNKEKILKMAKDQALETSLYGLFQKVQRSKSWEVLFQNENKASSLSAPDLWHNPNRGPKISVEDVKIEDSVEILDFVRFISACGIDPMLVKKAMEERMLLKGEKA